MVVYIYVKYVNKLRVVNNGLDLVLIWMMLEYPGYLFCAFVFKLQLLFRKIMFFYCLLASPKISPPVYSLFCYNNVRLCSFTIYIYILFIFMRCLKM